MTLDDRSHRLGEGSGSLANCKEAIEALRTVRDVFLGQPTTEDVVARAEETVGLRFPPSLRHFVLTVGKCEVGTHEILGISGASFATDAAVNLVGATLVERKRGLPAHCIVIENEGSGARLVLDTNRGYMVRRWEPGAGDTLSEQIRADFGAYLLMIVRDQQDEEAPDDAAPAEGRP